MLNFCPKKRENLPFFPIFGQRYRFSSPFLAKGTGFSYPPPPPIPNNWGLYTSDIHAGTGLDKSNYLFQRGKSIKEYTVSVKHHAGHSRPFVFKLWKQLNKLFNSEKNLKKHFKDHGTPKTPGRFIHETCWSNGWPPQPRHQQS